MILKGLLAVLLLGMLSVEADYISRYKMDGNTQVFMYHDDTHAKMINKNKEDSSSIYRIGKKVYIVTKKYGKTHVVDADEMKKLAHSLGGDTDRQKNSNTPKLKVKRTGKRVKVAGIMGEVWIVSGVEDGETFKEKVVVTKDRRVVKTVHAQTNMFLQMGDAENDGSENIFEIRPGYVTIKAEGMVLESFKEKKIPKSEYALPKDAKIQKMPDFAAMFGGTSGTKSSSKKEILDPCYNEVCCGKTAGKSRVLTNMLKHGYRGYNLKGSGVCDALGLSSTFGVESVEGALYKKGNDPIQITLSMDDSSGGAVVTTKKQLDAGVSMVVRSIKNYKKGNIKGFTYRYGLFMPMKQQTLDIILDSKTVLSITRKVQRKEIDLVNWTKHAINIQAFKKTKPKNKHEKTTTQNSDNSFDTDNIDKTVNMLKSFF